MAKRLLIIVQLDPSSTLGRVAQDMPLILKMLGGFSKETPLPAFRSSDGILSGFFIETEKPAGMIQAEFVSCQGTTNQDSAMILEIGDEIAGTAGMSRAWTWLQHRKRQ